MARIVLLNSGGYAALDGVYFPVEVDALAQIGCDGDVDGFMLSCEEVVRVGGRAIGRNIYFPINDECIHVGHAFTAEQQASRAAPSNPQTTDLAIHCNGIDEVTSSIAAGFKQMVTLKDACVEDVIENIGADRFFAAFDNEELAEHLRKYGYEVSKND